MATAAQFAFALTKTLSTKTIKKIGTEKKSRNLVWKVSLFFLIKKTKLKKSTGPIITAWVNKNSNPWKKLKPILSKPMLSEVWSNVTHWLFKFHKILGNTIKNTVNKKHILLNTLSKKTFLIFSSKKTQSNKDIKKYTAAYFAKNDNPKKIPKSKKFKKIGFFWIFIKIQSDKDQKKIKTTSVDSKKEETETAGNK